MEDSVWETVNFSFEPTEKDISEYAAWLGMDPEKDKELLWIARDALKKNLPHPWIPHRSEDGKIFYFNGNTGEGTWDHPCNDNHRRLYLIENKKMNGDTLSKDDKKYLQDIWRDDLIPTKIGTLVATLNDQGDVEVSLLSMCGDAFACAKLTHADGSQRFQSVQKALKEQVGGPLHLVLSDGRMIKRDDSKKLVREVIELSNAKAWPTTPPAEEEDPEEFWPLPGHGLACRNDPFPQMVTLCHESKSRGPHRNPEFLAALLDKHEPPETPYCLRRQTVEFALDVAARRSSLIHEEVNHCYQIMCCSGKGVVMSSDFSGPLWGEEYESRRLTVEYALKAAADRESRLEAIFLRGAANLKAETKIQQQQKRPSLLRIVLSIARAARVHLASAFFIFSKSTWNLRWNSV